SVPTMMTLGNQQFAQAFGNMYTPVAAGLAAGLTAAQVSANVPAQAFIEAALGGAGSAYCTGFTSCTAALVSKNASTINLGAVSDLWSAMNKASSWTLGR